MSAVFPIEVLQHKLISVISRHFLHPLARIIDKKNIYINQIFLSRRCLELLGLILVPNSIFRIEWASKNTAWIHIHKFTNVIWLVLWKLDKYGKCGKYGLTPLHKTVKRNYKTTVPLSNRNCSFVSDVLILHIATSIPNFQI